MQKLSDEQMMEIQKERLQHESVLKNIRWILSTKDGRQFIGYLFKALDVLEIPMAHLTGEMLMGRLGEMRAGHAIYKLVAEADPQTLGMIVGQLEKEKNEELYGNS